MWGVGGGGHVVCLFLLSFVFPDCEDRAEFAFNVQGSPPESITLELDLLQKKEANVFCELVNPSSTFTACPFPHPYC